MSTQGSTATGSKNARVIEAVLTSYSGKTQDISGLITQTAITQSIGSPTVKGNVVVQDNVGLLNSFPLLGEERLKLKIRDTSLGIDRTIEAFVYSIDNISPNTAVNGVNVTLNWITYTSFEMSKSVITKSYSTNASMIVQDIFNRYVSGITSSAEQKLPFAGRRFSFKENKDKYLYIQPNESLIKLIIPRVNTVKALNMVASRCYATDSPSCMFRFFETLDGYYFVTDEWLIQRAIDQGKVKDLVYSAQQNKTAQDEQEYTIESLVNSTRANSGRDILSGGYRNRFTEIDLIRKSVEVIDYNWLEDAEYIDMSGRKKKTSTSSHTTQFIEDTFTEDNAPSFLIFRDWTRSGDIPTTLNADQHISRIASNRVSYSSLFDTTTVQASLKGRSDIQAGHVVKLNIPELSAGPVESNAHLKGNYLVTTVVNSIVNDVMSTSLQLVKYNWG